MNLAGKDLNLVVALRALLEEGNVTRAAARLGVGQPGMSAFLSRLRSHYKDELLVRVGRSYELTPRARELLPLVQRAVPLLEESLGVNRSLTPTSVKRRFTIMLSDFAALELHSHLEIIRSEAPFGIDLLPLPEDSESTEAALRSHDFIVAVPAMGVEGDFAPLFTDHYVCLVDAQNPAVRDGTLSWDAFNELPLASATFGLHHHTPADRRLREMGFARKPQVVARGFLPLPSIVAGTSMVAVVPSRLAKRLGPGTGTLAVAAPFGTVMLNENLWWHPNRSADLGHRWLRTRLLGRLSPESQQT
jgi:DNA-binding transcriptional LysR family regulator